MRKGRFTEEQIIGVLKEGEKSKDILELCRRYGITKQTFYRWRTKYGNMEVNELRHLKDLERENLRLKRIVADQMLDIDGLKAALGKKY